MAPDAGNDRTTVLSNSLSLQIYAVVQNPSNWLRSDSIVGYRHIQTQRIVFPVYAPIGDAQYKLEVEWKIRFYRLETVDIRPRCRRTVDLILSGGLSGFNIRWSGVRTIGAHEWVVGLWVFSHHTWALEAVPPPQQRGFCPCPKEGNDHDPSQPAAGYLMVGELWHETREELCQGGLGRYRGRRSGGPWSVDGRSSRKGEESGRMPSGKDSRVDIAWVTRTTINDQHQIKKALSLAIDDCSQAETKLLPKERSQQTRVPFRKGCRRQGEKPGALN